MAAVVLNHTSKNTDRVFRATPRNHRKSPGGIEPRSGVLRSCQNVVSAKIGAAAVVMVTAGRISREDWVHPRGESRARRMTAFSDEKPELNS